MSETHTQPFEHVNIQEEIGQRDERRPRAKGRPELHEPAIKSVTMVGQALDLVVTVVGLEPEGIQIDREVAGLVKRHGGNISANDLLRHGNVINAQFVVEGDADILERLRRAIPVLASEFGVVGLAHDCTGVEDAFEVRSQSNYRFSLHGRDYKGLHFDILSAIESAGYRVMQCHGRLQSLWADEIPENLREDPGARVEYRLTVTLQPTPTASMKTLRDNFGRLYDERGVMWAPII